MDIKSIFGGVSEYLGKDTTGYFRPSLKGLAVQTSADGRYVAYDPDDERLVDVTGLDFQGLANFVYRVPVAVADVKPGDLIITSENPPTAAFVVARRNDGTLTVLNPKTADRGTYSPVKNLFGLQFLVKVISPTSGLAGEITDNKLLSLLLL